MVRSLIALIVMTIGYTAYGQSDSVNKEIITKIDSISRANSIERGTINFFQEVPGGMTKKLPLLKKQKFAFDGQFLVIGNSYFNIDKLLYFYIREDYIDFYFQGY